MWDIIFFDSVIWMNYLLRLNQLDLNAQKTPLRDILWPIA